MQTKWNKSNPPFFLVHTEFCWLCFLHLPALLFICFYLPLKFVWKYAAPHFLVGGFAPSEKMWKSVGMTILNIYGNIKNGSKPPTSFIYNHIIFFRIKISSGYFAGSGYPFQMTSLGWKHRASVAIRQTFVANLVVAIQLAAHGESGKGWVNGLMATGDSMVINGDSWWLNGDLVVI